MAKTIPRPAVPMAPAYMKTDSIRIDTSKAPWMGIAKAELNKKIEEHPDYDSFAAQLYLASVQPRRNARLLDPSPLAPVSVGRGMTGPLARVAHAAMGPSLADRNPEIVKYFAGVKTDPVRDKKGRSWDMGPVYADNDGTWRVTAWCAAFVNWCLQQAGAPRLGYATAASWLQFGTPLPAPEYGCVAVIPPAKATGSTTGHVAFYVETKGSNIVLLGGNQGDRVSEMLQPSNRVLGYRWPTHFNYFLLDRGSRLA